jgi:ABC-type amino acid transport substrate-binding protein
MDVVPYARCKHAVLHGIVPACVSMSWVPEFAGRVELASAPLIVLNVDVFENASNPLPRPRDGRCSLPPGARAGVVRKYEYPAEAAAVVRQGAIVTETDSDYHSLKMLAAGRLDAAIVMTNDLEPRNQKVVEAGAQGKVRWAFGCGHQTGTIGFSLKHLQGRAARAAYEAGYERIRANGKLREIAARWHTIVADATN